MSTPWVFIESDYDYDVDDEPQAFCVVNFADIAAFEVWQPDADDVWIVSAVLRDGERYTLWEGPDSHGGVMWLRSKLRIICERMADPS